LEILPFEATPGQHSGYLAQHSIGMGFANLTSDNSGDSTLFMKETK
jgi:hypothetical protein